MTILILIAVTLIVLDLLALARSLRHDRPRRPPTSSDAWTADGLPSRPYAAA
jgi:hypothetical protein